MHQLGFSVSLSRPSRDLVDRKHSIGLARLAETMMRRVKGKGENEKLTAVDKILASSIGGALATWNQPIEVIRIEVRFVLVP